MENVILFCLATIGLCLIIVDSVIMQPVRNWLKTKLPHNIYSIFECYQCSGTWCGFLMGWIFVSNSPFIIFGCGCAGGFLGTVSAMFLSYLEAQTIINLGDDKDE